MILVAIWVVGGAVMVGCAIAFLEAICELLDITVGPVLKVIAIPLVILFVLGLFLSWI